MNALSSPGLTIDKLNERAAAMRQNAATADRVINAGPQHVMWVYSGTDGKCCCGCAGIYRANSLHIAEATRQRGYQYLDAEINDRFVAKVLDTFKRHSDQIERVSDDQAALVVGDRLFMLEFAA